MAYDEDENFFIRFIKRNLPIITIIGVFLAVSKYIYGDGTDTNSVQISVICTIFVIFLLLMFILDSFSYIMKHTRKEFDKSFFEFLKSYPTYIPSIITIFFIAFLTYTISLITVQKYPFEVSIFVTFIEMCVSLIVAAIICLYIILKVNDKGQVAIIFVASFVVYLLSAWLFGFEHHSIDQIFSKPFWILFLVYGLMPASMGLFFVSIIKLGNLLQRDLKQ